MSSFHRSHLQWASLLSVATRLGNLPCKLKRSRHRRGRRPSRCPWRNVWHEICGRLWSAPLHPGLGEGTLTIAPQTSSNAILTLTDLECDRRLTHGHSRQASLPLICHQRGSSCRRNDRRAGPRRGSLFQDQLLECQVRDSLAQSVALFLKLLETLYLVALQTTKLLAPPAIRELRQADRAYSCSDRSALRQQQVSLAQLRSDLFGPMLLLGHLDVLSNGSIA